MTLRTCDANEGHELGVEPPLVVAIFLVFALYAAAIALGARGAESVWGAWAAGGYGAAALMAVSFWRRQPGIVLFFALTGAFALPAALLPPNWGATSEVRVVERAATLWLTHGSPYVASNHLMSWRLYDPYLPGMSVFGLPHALGLTGPLGDPLLWLAATTVALLGAACHIAAPGTAWQCKGCRHQAVFRALLLVASPVFAFPMALGVTDPPVIALMCLGLAWTARRSLNRPGLASARPHGPAGHFSQGVTLQRRGRPLLAGLAIGVGCALKATTWPALPVILALVAVRDGRLAAARFAVGSLGSFFVLIALTAPALFAQPGALWQNIVAYPLGLSRRRTPAASPLPGHLLASMGGLGHLAALLLLGGAALVIGASLVLRPPYSVQQATVRLAIGLALMFLLAPDARFGYFAYPLGILSWLILTFVNPRRRRFRLVAAGTERRRTSRQILEGTVPVRGTARGHAGVSHSNWHRRW